MAVMVQPHIGKRDDFRAVWESTALSDLHHVGVEQKRLLAHGVGIAVRTIIASDVVPAATPQGDSQSVSDHYEQVLAGISSLAGSCKTMKVEAAKEWIRNFDDMEAKSLASRLGKMSKMRNGKVHGDWLLLDAVEAMVSRSILAGPEADMEQKTTDLTKLDEITQQAMDEMSDFIGSWASEENPSIKIRTSLGTFASLQPDDPQLYKLALADGHVWFNGFQRMEHSKDTIRWYRRKGEWLPEKEVTWSRASLRTT